MERKDIVCHAFPSWRGDYVKSTIQIMKELAVNHNVLYVDYAYSWKDILFNSFKNRYIPVARVLGVRNPIETVNLENGGLLHVLSLPPVIPFNWISSPHQYLPDSQYITFGSQRNSRSQWKSCFGRMRKNTGQVEIICC